LRDLSLHILDLIENSIRAGATIVSVSVGIFPDRDLMEATVDDNGPGLRVPPDVATDPFYTTKNGKHIGLGLSLFRATAEKAKGKMSLCSSELGGLCVKATMQLSHVDRCPIGDLAGTMSSVVCTNANLDLRFRFTTGDRTYAIKVADLVDADKMESVYGLTVAREVHQRIKEGLSTFAVHD
jgi:anti-sigma regulatory factor (Ser/Thr protein kinase)